MEYGSVLPGGACSPDDTLGNVGVRILLSEVGSKYLKKEVGEILMGQHGEN